jgi:hypothetical protein
MKEMIDIELKNKEFELRTLMDSIEMFFDMPKHSMLWDNFYRFHKKRLEGKIP